MLDIIVRETTEKLNACERNVAHPNNENNGPLLAIIELKTFIGLSLLAGMNRSHMEQLCEL